MSLDGEGGDGLDDKAGRGALPVDQHLLDAVFLHLQLPQRAELTQAAQRQLEVVPVRVLLTDLVPGEEEKSRKNVSASYSVILKLRKIHLSLQSGYISKLTEVKRDLT